MKTNVKPKAPPRALARTAEGALASPLNVEQTIKRMSAAAMLWEDNFYVDGKTSAQIISELVPKASPVFLAQLASDLRSKMKLRHMPLLIAREMARASPAHRKQVGAVLADVIQRPDELTEFMAIYWKDDPKQPLSKQVKKGLAKAMTKFSEYALAKYNRENAAVRLRDVAFLTHVKPKDEKQADVFARLVNREKIPVKTKGGHAIIIEGREEPLMNFGLDTPDTWEVELSAKKGESKQQSWQRLLVENKLGALAFLRNLRNMTEAGVTETALTLYASKLDLSRVLPFRFVAASRAVPQLETVLEAMMLKALKDAPKLAGRTVMLVDVSGSMQGQISAKSDLNRLDAAASLAILLREVCENVVIGAFDDTTQLVKPRRGFALRDAIGKPRGGTDLAQAVRWANTHKPDRIVVFTDEQSHSSPPAPTAKGRGYIINVATNQHGVGYGDWHHIHGFSEAVIDYLREVESV